MRPRIKSVKKKIISIMNKIGVAYDIMRDMPRPKADARALQHYVKQKMREKDLGVTDVSKNARAASYEIDQTYVSRIVNGQAGHLTIPKLQALAAGLQVSEEELIDVARGAKPPDDKFKQSDMYQIFLLRDELKWKHHRDFVDTTVHILKRTINEFRNEEEAGEEGPASPRSRSRSSGE